MKIHIFASSFVSFLWAASAFAAVDVVKLRDSSDDQAAFGSVDFSYLHRQKKTDQNGNIKLPPPPHDKADPIEVCPDNRTKYGACFRQQFPKDDGFIWLVTRSGALTLERIGEDLARQEKFKPAAALTAIASEFYKIIDHAKSDALLRKALGFLARNYNVLSSATAGVSPDERLRRAALDDSTVQVKPAAEGAWDSLDVLYVAGETRSEALKTAGLASPR